MARTTQTKSTQTETKSDFPPFAPDFSAFAPDFSAFANGGATGFSAWMGMNQALMEGFGKMQEEAGRFLSKRLREDFEWQKELMACRTPDQMWGVYREFVQQMMVDYSDEAKRQSEIASEVQSSYAHAGTAGAKTAADTAKAAAEAATAATEPPAAA